LFTAVSLGEILASAVVDRRGADLPRKTAALEQRENRRGVT
jgi:hypothetical protein